MSRISQWSSSEEEDEGSIDWKTRALVAEQRVFQLTKELQQLKKEIKNARSAGDDGVGSPTDKLDARQLAYKKRASNRSSMTKPRTASRTSSRLASEACSFCTKRNKIDFKFCVHCGEKRLNEDAKPDDDDAANSKDDAEEAPKAVPNRRWSKHERAGGADEDEGPKTQQQGQHKLVAGVSRSTADADIHTSSEDVDVDVDTSTTDETDVALEEEDAGKTNSSSRARNNNFSMGGARTGKRSLKVKPAAPRATVLSSSIGDGASTSPPSGGGGGGGAMGFLDYVEDEPEPQPAVVLAKKAETPVRIRHKTTKSPRDNVRVSPRPSKIKSLLARASVRTKSMGNFGDSQGNFGASMAKQQTKVTRNSPPVAGRKIALLNYQQTPKGVLFMVSVESGDQVTLVPRSLQTFRDLASSFGLDPSLKRLTKSSAEKDIVSVHAKLQVLLQQVQEVEDTEGALAMFIDAHYAPSVLGLSMLEPPPLMRGEMQMQTGARKWRTHLFILHHNLYCFRGEDSLEPVVELPLEYVTVEIIRDKEYPGHCFKLDDLNSGNTTEFSVESTKLVGEWILAIREAKVNRMGLGYWVKDQQEGDLDDSALPTGEGLKWLLSGEPPPLVSDALDVIGERGLQETTAASELYIRALTEGAEGWTDNIAEDLMCYPLHFASPGDFLWNLVVLLLKRSVPRKRKVRVVSIMREWAELHPGDFCGDQELMAALIGVMSQWEPEAVEEFTLQVVPEGKKETKARLKAAPRPIRPDMYRRDAFDFIDVHPLEIARQLSLLELRLFKSIEMRELIGQAWNKKGENLAPNVSNVIQRFNLMSGWITSLLVRVPETRPRVALLARFIDIAGYCLQLKNFNSLVEIVSALGTSAVRRLTDTWDLLPEDSKTDIAKFRAILETRKNWAVYRQALADVPAGEACVPYLGLYLTDLTFVDERHKVFLKDSCVVNPEHRGELASLLLQLRQFQQRDYCLMPVSYFQEYLMRLDQLDEEEAYALSLLRQPRLKK